MPHLVYTVDFFNADHSLVSVAGAEFATAAAALAFGEAELPLAGAEYFLVVTLPA